MTLRCYRYRQREVKILDNSRPRPLNPGPLTCPAHPPCREVKSTDSMSSEDPHSHSDTAKGLCLGPASSEIDLHRGYPLWNYPHGVPHAMSAACESSWHRRCLGARVCLQRCIASSGLEQMHKLRRCAWRRLRRYGTACCAPRSRFGTADSCPLVGSGNRDMCHRRHKSKQPNNRIQFRANGKHGRWDLQGRAVLVL